VERWSATKSLSFAGKKHREDGKKPLGSVKLVLEGEWNLGKKRIQRVIGRG